MVKATAIVTGLVPIESSSDMTVAFDVAAEGFSNGDAVTVARDASKSTILAAIDAQARVNAANYYSVTFDEGDTVRVCGLILD